MGSPDYAALTHAAHRLAVEAGRAIMRLYRTDVDMRVKDDASPVTEADEIADRTIVAGLRAASPDILVVSEESVATLNGDATGAPRFWLVDPLDGTKEFLRHTGEFTVNIALIEDRRPVLGVLHVPARDETYLADPVEGARVVVDGGAPAPIRARPVPAEGVIAVASRSHRDPETDAFIAANGVSDVTSAGSALKFGLVARGAADLYPRFGRTMEWDTAAGHAILSAAGGSVRCLDGSDLLYGKADFANPSFIARGAT